MRIRLRTPKMMLTATIAGRPSIMGYFGDSDGICTDGLSLHSENMGFESVPVISDLFF